MSKYFSEKDFYALVGAKSNVAPNTVKRVWNNIIELMISELQNNSYIQFKNFGKFYTTKKGGKDEWFENKITGIPERRYVEPFDFVEFEPSNNFVNTVNDGLVDAWAKSRFNNDNLTNYDKILLGLQEEKTTAETIFELLNKKDKRREKEKEREKLYQNNKNLGYKEKFQGKPLLCLNNGVEYPSMNNASLKLNIRKEKLYNNLKKGIMETDGYKFEWIGDNPYEEGD